VTRSDPNGTVVLDSPPKATADRINFARDAFKLKIAKEGLAFFRGAPNSWNAGDWIKITDGPTYGDEPRGELRRIKAADSGQITLDRPLRCTYGPTALVCRVTLTQNVAIRDLTLGKPLNQASVPAFFQFAHGVIVERVRCEGDLQVGNQCSDVQVRDCLVDETIGYANGHDLKIQDSRCRHLFFEQMAFDCDIQNVEVVGSRANGVYTNPYAPCERLRFRKVTVDGAGNMPISVGGRDCSFVDCIVRNSRSDAVCYFLGDRLVIRNLKSDRHVCVLAGRDVNLSQIRARLILGGKEAKYQPTGTAIDCGIPNVSNLSRETLAKWRIRR
jgi:hypothetical protein